MIELPMDSKDCSKNCSYHPEVSALLYCNKCKKYMCAECKNAHDFFFTKGHDDAIVPPEQADESPSQSVPETKIRKCEMHPDYPLDTICNDCNSTIYYFIDIIIIIYLF